jgi:hypothetical protein
MRDWRFLLLLTALIAAPCFAKNGKGRGAHKPGHGVSESGVVAHVNVYSGHDRRVIREYFDHPPEGLPPGLAKRGSLPPGLQKQLRRNGQLPPGLQKKLYPFPVYLEDRLPPLPGGYRRGLIGDFAVIYQPSRNVIVDVFGVF